MILFSVLSVVVQKDTFKILSDSLPVVRDSFAVERLIRVIYLC